MLKIILPSLFVVAIISCKSKDNNTNKIKNIRLTTYFVDTQSSEIKEGSLFTDETYEYDSSFNLLKEEYRTYKYDFDKYGNKVKGYIYNFSGNLIQTELFKNNSSGNLIEIIEYDSEMKNIENKTLLKYNEMNNIVKQLKYDESDSIVEKYDYVYDSKKMEIKKTSRKYNSLYFNYYYQYDAKKRIVEKTKKKNCYGTTLNHRINIESTSANVRINQQFALMGR